jgi:DNA-binding MarR family transcriptional regulator
VFGVGLGLVMQILVVAVQNSVDYDQLGTATSGATFFRSIGGSFGTAVFGAVFANLLVTNVAKNLHLTHVPATLRSALGSADPTSLSHLPPVIKAGVVNGLVHTIQTVFLIAVPIALVAFLLSWLLPEIELRKTVRTVDTGEGFGLPETRSSLEEIQLALERIALRENRRELYETLSKRAGLTIDARSCWLLYRLADRPDCSVEQIAKRLDVDPSRIEQGVDSLVSVGMIKRQDLPDGCNLSLTQSGENAIHRLADARRAGFNDLLEGWDPDDHPEIGQMVRRLAHELLADDDRLLADATAGAKKEAAV